LDVRSVSDVRQIEIHTTYMSLASRNFRDKKREYLKDRINYIATHSKNKNIKTPV
jgi:hypothetical protein